MGWRGGGGCTGPLEPIEHSVTVRDALAKVALCLHGEASSPPRRRPSHASRGTIACLHLAAASSQETRNGGIRQRQSTGASGCVRRGARHKRAKITPCHAAPPLYLRVPKGRFAYGAPRRTGTADTGPAAGCSPSRSPRVRKAAAPPPPPQPGTPCNGPLPPDHSQSSPRPAGAVAVAPAHLRPQQWPLKRLGCSKEGCEPLLRRCRQIRGGHCRLDPWPHRKPVNFHKA